MCKIISTQRTDPYIVHKPERIVFSYSGLAVTLSGKFIWRGLAPQIIHVKFEGIFGQVFHLS